MFTHPALLRHLTLTADHLRRAGESAWARRMVMTADRVRKSGWTEHGKAALQELFEAPPLFEALNLGAEHERRLGGPQGVSDANLRLSELRVLLKEMGTLPLRASLDPGAPRQRSPDLA